MREGEREAEWEGEIGERNGIACFLIISTISIIGIMPDNEIMEDRELKNRCHDCLSPSHPAACEQKRDPIILCIQINTPRRYCQIHAYTFGLCGEQFNVIK